MEKLRNVPRLYDSLLDLRTFLPSSLKVAAMPKPPRFLRMTPETMDARESPRGTAIRDVAMASFFYGQMVSLVMKFEMTPLLQTSDDEVQNNCSAIKLRPSIEKDTNQSVPSISL